MKQLTSLFIVLFATVAIQVHLASADDWSQWRGENREGIWNETGIIEKFEGPEVPIRWRVPIGSGYSGPSVADGRVYITDRLDKPKQVERVHCFDWKPGIKSGLTPTIAYIKLITRRDLVPMLRSMMDSLMR